jgi:hypothetical protein
MKHIWNILYDRYPRQFAVPNRVDINSISELYENAYKYSQTTRCFVSVYNYTYGCRDVIIDKAILDIDPSVPTFYEDTIKISEFLETQNYKHIVVFSGGGFHIYIRGNPAKMDKKNGLIGFQRWIKDKTKVNIDTSSFGDIARIIGLPYTYNFKRGKYIIPLSKKLLHSGLENIKEEANNNGFADYDIIGKENVIFDNFSSYLPDVVSSKIEFDEQAVKNMKDSLLDALPPCVQNILMKGNLNHDERYFVISCMMEKQWTDEMVKAVLKKYLVQDKFYHCVLSKDKMRKGKKCEGQVDYVRKKFQDPKWRFASCKTIAERGWCVKPNCRKHPDDILR